MDDFRGPNRYSSILCSTAAATTLPASVVNVYSTFGYGKCKAEIFNRACCITLKATFIVVNKNYPFRGNCEAQRLFLVVKVPY